MSTRTRCHARQPPTGETGSWIRDHTCRWPYDHDSQPHECTCGHVWDTDATQTTSTQTTDRSN